jgi:uncharacterized protein with beta-barrel porin domain
MIADPLTTRKSRPADASGRIATPRALGLFVAAGTLGLSFAGEASAACAPGASGPLDYKCVGAISSATTVTNSTSTALVGATLTNALTVNRTSAGDVAFSMDAGSSITAAGTALTLDATAAGTVDGSVLTTTPFGANINGAITSTGGQAIVARANGLGQNVDLTTGARAISGATGGIAASASDDGSVNLTLNGAVTATNGNAIDARAVDGAVNITANAAVSGGATGIQGYTTGSGLIAIRADGDVSSKTGTAIWAGALGTGDVTVYATGAVSSAANGVLPPGFGFLGAVSGSSAGGNVTITTLGTVDAASGIYAETSGAGAANVTTGDTLTARSGAGVTAVSVDGNALVQVGGGGIVANTDGVVASATGLGAVAVGVHGDVAATLGTGVSATSNSGAIQIDLDAGTFVSGAVAGLSVTTTTGAAVVTNDATISGTGLVGDGVVIDANGGTAVLFNNGVIETTGGSAINVKSGAALIANTGTIDGMVTSAAGTIVTLNNDGVWSNAAGSTVGYLNNTGTIGFGPAGGAVGLITVTGDATFAPGSVLNMRMVGGVADGIAVGGVTTITGGRINLSGDGVGLARGQKYTLITSVGGVTGNFDGVSSDMSSFTGYLTNDGASITMTMLARDFRSLALNRNQYAAATAIWQASGALTGSGITFMRALNGAPDSAIPAALTQISGDGVVTGAANAAFQAGHLFSSLMQDQTDVWQSGGSNNVNSITIREPFAYAPVQSNKSRWPVSRQQYAPPQPQQRVLGNRSWRVWASGFGGQSTFQGDNVTGAARQSASSAGGAMGVDYQLGQRMLIGVAAGYSANSWSANSGVAGTTNGLHFGAYTGFNVGAFYIDASVAYASYENKTKRSVAVLGGVAGETENGAFTSEEVRTRVEIGRKINFEAMAITPFAAVEVAHIHSKAFSESGIASTGEMNVFSLAFAGQGMNSIPTFIGLKMESRIDAGPIVLTPWVSVAWRHEWSPARNQTASLVSLPGATFVTQGARAASDTLQVKAGAQVQITKTAALYATFEGEFLTKNPVYAGKGGVRVGW